MLALPARILPAVPSLSVDTTVGGVALKSAICNWPLAEFGGKVYIGVAIGNIRLHLLPLRSDLEASVVLNVGTDGFETLSTSKDFIYVTVMRILSPTLAVRLATPDALVKLKTPRQSLRC